MTPKCKVERYRSVTGLCNNLDHPHWGSAMNAHHRFLAPDFADGISAPRISVTGRPLPSARAVSTAGHRDTGFHDHAVTILLVAWGQLMDHDITLTGETKDPRTGKTPKCCEGSTHPNCLPIEIPSNDKFYSKHNQRCMNFLESPDEGCIRPSEDVYCFLAGDGRVNEQTVLAIIHTMLVREHNEIATEMSQVNPHWNDETIFQETRHIMAAIMQHITYNEFLPMVLGKDVMGQLELVLLKDGYSDTYDPYVNPSASNAFSTAAFRFGHTLLPSTIERWSKSHRYVGSQRLSEMLQQPYDLYKGGWADTYLLGLINQVAQAYDDSVTQEVTNHLFQEPGKKFGMDLAALNIQRGREHGIPGYNKWREFCGLPKVRSFDELLGLMTNFTVAGYSRVYDSPDDIDLWSAGISEKPLPGSMLGPTFACIIGKQFQTLRHGDRYWYENGGWPSSFTLEQLNEIRKMKLSRMLCDTSDDIDNLQVYAMVLPDHEINPRVSCKSAVLPKMDMSKWRDASYHSASSEFQPF
eukprot:snap_masked-scaffold491_size156641-processed-gene-0.8 protein:Tk05480 transcript:snap_masked-scaffold491_size156641-processed-gene-0.8-mRNA-1 annotation:"hypothetical protein DAPPUDRAFT_301956"